jgi:hypothetical protein
MTAKVVKESKTIPTTIIEISSELVEITPAMAREWLEKNIENNRGVGAQVVDAYARDMLAGKWYIPGDPIRFDEDGNLIDGQHRLVRGQLA